MGYNEISQMDEEPFDMDVLGEVCDPYCSVISMLPDLFAILIMLYFRKFDEQYGTGLTKRVGMIQVISGYEEDDNYDEPFWFTEAPRVMEQAMCIGGWHEAWLGVNEEELSSILKQRGQEEEGKRKFSDVYSKMIDSRTADRFLKACFLQETEMVMETAEMLEDGQVGILWNESLNWYMQYRMEHPDIVAAICPEEDGQIVHLDAKVWEPYMITYFQDERELEEGEYAGRRYCRVALGSDGYNYCWYDCINPNWICSAVKLGLMLDLAMEKIEKYRMTRKGEAV